MQSESLNDDAVLEQFLLEAEGQLRQASDELLALEESGSDPERLDGIFRSVHTVKGGAGLFDAPSLNRLLHETEQVLHQLRDGEQTLSASMVDELLQALDHCMAWVSFMSEGDSPDDDWEVQAAKLLPRLQSIRGEEASGDPEPEQAIADFTADGFQVEQLQWAFRHAMTDTPPELLWVTLKPEGDCLLNGKDPLNDMARLPGLMALACGGPVVESVDSLDPFAHQLEYHALLSKVSEATIITLLAEYPSSVKVKPIEPLSLVRVMGSAKPITAQQEILSQLEQALKAEDAGAFKAAVEAGLELGGEGRRLHSILSWLALLDDWGELSDERRHALLACIDEGQPSLTRSGQAPSQASTSSSTAADGADSDDGFGFFDTPEAPQGTEVEQSGSQPVGNEQDDGFGLFDEAPGLPGDQEFAVVTEPSTDDASPPAVKTEQKSTSGRQREHVQVSLEHLDRMGELVGELIVARNGLPYLARQAEKGGNARDLARAIKDQGKVLERLTQDIQRTVSAAQMQPVKTTFQRFRRLVRDTSRRLDKTVELVLEGEETEADRHILTSMVDPLTHLVRNALDHGLESTAEREEKGKPATGQLLMRARNIGETLRIDVVDDGGGIDPDAVGQRALERGLIDQETFDGMSVADKQALIFMPGFSTAETVSEVSGRGVGMDAVQSTIRELGGRIEIDSQVGQGSCISLFLPLSMAVSRLLLVHLDGQDIGLPMSSVREILRLPESRVEMVHTQAVIQVRDEVIPVSCLRERLNLSVQRQASAERTYVLVRLQGQGVVALEVDDVEEDMEVVVKPLEGVLANSPAFNGSALLGDGRILLALDLEEVLS